MERICTKCGNTHPIEMFKKLHGDGYSNYCEDCRRKSREAMQRVPKEKKAAQHKAWRERNKSRHQEYMRAYNMQYWHGISLEQFTQLMEQQDGVCAICKESPIGTRGNERLHIDHDHVTNMVRGLLCSSCNTALGLLKDNVTIMNTAIAYLQLPPSGIVINPGLAVAGNQELATLICMDLMRHEHGKHF